MNRPSARLILVGMTLSVLAGSAAVASADSDTSGDPTDHMLCLIDQDGPTGPQHGLCIMLPLDLPTGS
jgi:hypothetical protein